MGGPQPVKPQAGPWLPLFSHYSLGVYGESRVLRGMLREDLSRHDPLVRDAVERWQGSSFIHEADQGLEVVLVDRHGGGEPARWGLHLFLFALTLLTTFMAGALLVGVDPLGAEPLDFGGLWLPVPTTVEWGALLRGAPFGAALVGILLAHELGHYFAARIHGIPVTPPFFIPFPAYYSIVGTLGAFIRLKGPIARRSILFDIGAAGPWASFVLGVPAFALGLSWSRPAPGSADTLTPFVIQFAGEPIWIGSSAVTGLLAKLLLSPDFGIQPIALHPVAFAGWVGLFVTALNLLPSGQLDGGHVLYALVGSGQRWAGYVFLLALLPLGTVWWGWWLWGGAAVFLSRGRVRHPPVLQEPVSLTGPRRILGWLTIVVFFLTFAPLPLAL